MFALNSSRWHFILKAYASCGICMSIVPSAVFKTPESSGTHGNKPRIEHPNPAQAGLRVVGELGWYDITFVIHV